MDILKKIKEIEKRALLERETSQAVEDILFLIQELRASNRETKMLRKQLKERRNKLRVFSEKINQMKNKAFLAKNSGQSESMSEELKADNHKVEKLKRQLKASRDSVYGISVEADEARYQRNVARGCLEIAVGALEWYVDEENHKSNRYCRHCSGDRWQDDLSNVEKDNGERANKALIRIKKEIAESNSSEASVNS